MINHGVPDIDGSLWAAKGIEYLQKVRKFVVVIGLVSFVSLQVAPELLPGFICGRWVKMLSSLVEIGRDRRCSVCVI